MGFQVPVSLVSFEEVAWYKATTLSERAALRRVAAAPRSSDTSEAATKFFRSWRTQSPFTSSRIFSQRLAALGIPEDEFFSILGEPAASVRDRYRSNPEWLVRLSEIFSDNLMRQVLACDNPSDEPIFDLINVAKPLISYGLQRLQERGPAVLKKKAKSPLSMETLQRSFIDSVARQFLPMLSRTMVLELNVARIQGSLEGNTSEERYRRFIHRLSQTETALAMMLEYPVLARQLVIRVDQCIDFILEFIDRLCSDWTLILQKFGPKEHEIGLVTHIAMDAGDRHRGGRCVVITTFSSGFKLVYKPKSMAIEAHFEALVNWINARGGAHPRLQTLKTLDRGCYGWSEFARVKNCKTLSEIRRFYERQGAYLALLYVLEATDFHNENIIASGEHPILIDIEAMFHPRLETPELFENCDSEALAHSVLRVGLLPLRIDTNEDSDGIDLSGLGGAGGQVTPYKVPYWEDIGTDAMKLSRRHMPVRSSNNRPSLNGLDIAPSDYIPEIVSGFTSVYRVLVKHREDFVSPDGPLLRFANDEVRVIFRPTRTYGVLLDESFHPDVLRDALHRDLLFDRLWIAVDAFPYLAKVIPAEYGDLQLGDIPYFSTRPASRHLWSSTHFIADFFEEPALSLAEHRVRHLDDHDLGLQCWFIQASLATTEPGHFQKKTDPIDAVEQQQRPFDSARLLSAARTLGDMLVASAIRWNQNASWVGLALTSARQWQITPLMLDLYDGLSGVALFLAYLGRVTGECQYSDLARDTSNTLLFRAEKFKSVGICIGGFAGWGGIIYALAHLGSLWHDSALLRRAEELVHLLAAFIVRDENFDVVAGSAGCIGSLIALCHELRSQETFAAAKACGDRLVVSAKRMTKGVGWIIPNQATPLAGFAHGAAGIAWALLKLSELTGETCFRKTAAEAIAYERTLFDPLSGNWRDLRTRQERSPGRSGEPSMSAWCHGAAGIGLARLSTASQLYDDEVRREIDVALATTLTEGFGHNHSLCHGDMGNFELLSQASRTLKDERWYLEAQRIASVVAEKVLGNERQCGTPLHVDSPGLMTGLAGIGYGLLRMAMPGTIPCVLTLEPPLGA